MSEQEQVKEEWYEYNGSTYHKDKYGKWWVGKTGYENLYVNGIDHSGLREDIGKMIENNQLNNKDQFQYNEEKFINQAIQALGFDSVDMYRKHLEKSNVNRKRQKDGYKY